MNFQELKSFCTVVEEKSITGAARKLFLTQPAISQQVRNLEERLNTQLLVRGVREVQPTEQGRLLYSYARRIIHLSEQAEVAIQTSTSEISGDLRVGTINSLGLHLISPVFEFFLSNNKNVRLKLLYAEGREVLELLKRREIDIAVLPDANAEYGGDPQEAEKRKLREDELWFVVSGKAKQLPRKIKFAEIVQFPFIMYAREYPGFEKRLRSELKRSGIHQRPVFESSNVGTLKRIIESGLGWGFLPAHAIKKQVQSGRLERVEIEGFSYPIEITSYIGQPQMHPKTAELFLKTLDQQ